MHWTTKVILTPEEVGELLEFALNEKVLKARRSGADRVIVKSWNFHRNTRKITVDLSLKEPEEE